MVASEDDKGKRLFEVHAIHGDSRWLLSLVFCWLMIRFCWFF